MIDSGKKQVVESKHTKYEIARILGARALQLSMNAPVLLKLEKKELEAVNYDPLKIAEMELYEGVLPITVKRPLPQRSTEKIIKVKEEVKEKAEEKKEEKVQEQAKEKEVEVGAPEKEEEEIIKAVEGTEVMELAKPEDETEPEGEFEADAGGED
jgi:DNA-directed RNA polymerase subunit K/omega